MKDKNILIAGGGGELGNCLIDHIKNKKYKIFVLDKKFKNKTKLSKIKYLKFDFLKKKKSSKSSQKYRCSVFFCWNDWWNRKFRNT